MGHASGGLAVRRGLRVAKTDCTGPASVAASRNAGMQEVYKLAYDEYKVNGEVVFKINPRRGSHLIVMAAKLQKYPPYVVPIHAESDK